MRGDNEQTIPAHKKLDKGDLFWLSYLIFFVIEPATRHSTLFWAESVAYLAAFIGLYVVFMRYCRFRLRLALLLGMLLLGLASYPRNPGGTSFMIYAAALLPFVASSIPLVLGLQAAECIVLAVEGYLFHISPWSWISGILLILTVGGSNVGFAQKQRADRKLRMQAEEIEALAAVAERERIARDLHDVLGHTLSVIVLKAELASRLLQSRLGATDAQATSPSQEDDAVLRRAASEIADVETTARSALAEVREAIGGYRSRGLRAEVDTARRILSSAGVTLHSEDPLDFASVTAAEETVLALALREAVTNIVRHARATECTLGLRREASLYQLSIRDNGEHALAREGNGLRGMRERVEALGGQLRLSREAGTRLLIEIPHRLG